MNGLELIAIVLCVTANVSFVVALYYKMDKYKADNEMMAQMAQKSIYDINKLQCENDILQSQLDAARNPERELKPPF